MSDFGGSECQEEYLVNVENALDILYDDILKLFTQKVQETHQTLNNNIDEWRAKTFGCIHYLRKDLKQKRDEEISRTDKLSQRVFILEKKFTQLKNHYSRSGANSNTGNMLRNCSYDEEGVQNIIKSWNRFVKRSEFSNKIRSWPSIAFLSKGCNNDKHGLTRLKRVPRQMLEPKGKASHRKAKKAKQKKAINDVQDLPSGCSSDETDDSKEFRCTIDGYSRDLHEGSKRRKSATLDIVDFALERKLNGNSQTKSRKTKTDDPVLNQSFRWSLTLKKPLQDLINFTGPVVYTGQPGYRLQLKAELDSQKGVISIALRLIEGIYDNKLSWPFQKNVLCVLFMGELLKEEWVIKPEWSNDTSDTVNGLSFQNYWSTWCGPFGVQDVLCANEILVGISLV